jgi:hypothetical protein
VIITVEISENELSNDDIVLILQGLGLSPTNNCEETLSKITRCALLEYRKMFVERGLPTKAAEVMQERLFYLIKGYFIDTLPSEQQISTVFQLTSSGSKTLLRNTISRYRIYLNDQINESIRRVISTAVQDGEKFLVVIQSETIRDEINKYLTQNRPTLQKLLAVKGSAGQYYCPTDTMNCLQEAFGVMNE